MSMEHVEKIAEMTGGTIEEVGALPDGSGFAIVSMPLPKDHWIYEECGEPPMPWRMGTDNPEHKATCEKIRAATMYAVRAATMSGKDRDFDPDALVQNMLVGMLGYHTPDGFSRI